MSTSFLSSFGDNFVESVALILSRGLTDSETEQIVSSWTAFQRKLKKLSAENLKKLEIESVTVRPYCKHQGSCASNAVRGFVKSFIVIYGIKYGLGLTASLVSGQLFRDPSLLLKLAGKDTISLTLFLSSFTSVFKAVLCTLRRVRKTNDVNMLLM